MIHNSKFNDRGFTLLEILIAISLLSLIITITVGIFVSGSESQRKIIELSVAQREGGYLMETMSRELRMATDINVSQENNNDSSLEFTNHEGDLIEYCRSDISGTCFNNGPYLARNNPNGLGGYISNNVISSSDVTIEGLKFFTSEFFNNQTQPLITISMKVKSKNSNIIL
jgi:prepilin-type N-terminal cleavage/methylation domain-containing protein